MSYSIGKAASAANSAISTLRYCGNEKTVFVMEHIRKVEALSVVFAYLKM